MDNISRISNKQNCSEEINEMICRLRQYESLCIQKEDYALADEAKKKIEVLKDQQVYVRQETIAVMEKQHISSICREGEDEVRKFQEFWDLEIQRLIQELKETEQNLTEDQKGYLEEYAEQVHQEQVPRVKYGSKTLELRKYLTNLIKTRNYKEAQNVKNKLKEHESAQQEKWVEKTHEKRRLRIEKLEKKQVADLQALRVKLEAIFNEKIKERDRKFEILLKKNRKRRIQSSKPSRKRIKSKNGALSESKCFLNYSRS